MVIKLPSHNSATETTYKLLARAGKNSDTLLKAQSKNSEYHPRVQVRQAELIGFKGDSKLKNPETTRSPF